MRKIKFRVWDLDNQKMYYQDDEELDFIFWHFDHNNIYITEIVDGYDLTEGGHVDNEYKPNQVVMQFTGLHDKNGKEIYEGDILRDERLHGDFIDDVIEVKYKDGKFCYSNYGTDGDLYDVCGYCEIIGNIYEGATNDNK